MIATLRACLVALNLVISTTVFGGIVLLSALFRVKDSPKSPYAWCPNYWGLPHLWVGGVDVIEHDVQHKTGAQHIFVANHLGNFDVFALAAKLPWIKFVAKAELFRVPLLGPAMARAGMIPVERANRKSAFASYTAATEPDPAGRLGGRLPRGHPRKRVSAAAVQEGAVRARDPDTGADRPGARVRRARAPVQGAVQGVSRHHPHALSPGDPDRRTRLR
ncbi:MAG: 1-acyl-sn-glycerol-3-phosphate acyltransferase [Gemmatimonadetes bacterium]|nr:1-acyl-sn-glycerol-3-phosphate acyltransferase [Gemmatimonadota bacterium]